MLLMASCANVGMPSGGPRDEDPPQLLHANPPQGALNVSKPEITLTFDEIVNVKDAFSKVVQSPAGRAPRVTAQGKKITVRFDSLAPNTTYTIDFADAIEDNNEGNKLQNFAYTFSTGHELDTLRIAGRVLGARDLEPRPGILVGVHRSLPDSAMRADSIFMKTPMLRVAKTDDRGRFIIRGLAPGNYRVFAIMDTDNDSRYSADNEEMAFYDLDVSPYTESVAVTDTIWDSKTGTVDTVADRIRTRYLPNDILLRSFVSARVPQFVARYERPDSARLFLKMNAPAKKLPAMRLLGHEGKFPGIVESREQLDSVTVWLPPTLAAQDSLLMAVDYVREERGKAPVSVTDTLKFIRKKLPVPKKRKKEKINARDSLALITTTFAFKTSGVQEVWKPLEIEVTTPLATLDTNAFHLMMLTDTVWKRAPRSLSIYHPDSVSPRMMTVDYPWDFGTKYRLEIDSLAGTDIYGRTTLPLKQEFSTRPLDEYCSMTFDITGLEPGMPAFVELLNGSDQVDRVARVENGRAYFPYLQAGKYYARLIEDYNGNGLYDTGDYQTDFQPELAYYYPKVINIKKNWDKEEVWDVYGTAIDLQKPLAVTKNKPKTPKKGTSKKKKGERDDGWEEEEEDLFDPTANPFEERSGKKRRR